jgi:hypothetical protein
MKNMVKLFGIIAVAAVIGLSMAGCSDSSEGASGTTITGTWINVPEKNIELTLNNGRFEFSGGYNGTYTLKVNTKMGYDITLKSTDGSSIKGEAQVGILTLTIEDEKYTFIKK